MERTGELQQRASLLREKANGFFKGRKFPQAINLYTQALELHPENAACYANRSAANLKLELLEYALADAYKATECDRNYLKAYYRRAEAQTALGNHKIALEDYKWVCKLQPDDEVLKKQLVECKKIVDERTAINKGMLQLYLV